MNRIADKSARATMRDKCAGAHHDALCAHAVARGDAEDASDAESKLEAAGKRETITQRGDGGAREKFQPHGIRVTVVPETVLNDPDPEDPEKDTGFRYSGREFIAVQPNHGGLDVDGKATPGRYQAVAVRGYLYLHHAGDAEPEIHVRKPANWPGNVLWWEDLL